MDSTSNHVRKGSTSTVSTEGGDGGPSKLTRDNKKGFVVNSRIKRGGSHLRLARPGKISAASSRPNVLTRTTSHNPNYDRIHSTHATLPRQRSLNDLNDLHGTRAATAKTGLIPLTQRKPKLVWEEVTNDNDSTAGNFDTESVRTDLPETENHNPPPLNAAQPNEDQSRKIQEGNTTVLIPKEDQTTSEGVNKTEHENVSSLNISLPPATATESSIKEEKTRLGNVNAQSSSDQHKAVSDRPLGPTDMYPTYPLATPSASDTVQSSPVHKNTFFQNTSTDHEPLPPVYLADFQNQNQERISPKALTNAESFRNMDSDTHSVTTSLPGDLLTNRKFSSNVTKTPAQLYDIGASTSRTQQKLLIQRASSRFDTAEDDPNANPSKRYLHPQAKQITDSVRTHLRNVIKNREIVYEFLIKLRPFVISSEIEDFSSSSNPFTSSPHAPSSSNSGQYPASTSGFSSNAHSVNPSEILHSSQPSYPLANTRRKSIHVPKVRKGEEPETVENKILELWK
ncbi:TORC1 subunit Tco89 [Schizosaccharomyces octosporus yFS286]|uniref:TORC1 subunit Tco89 n=1 Tax=Schizosaccharomyces octosporus (strain yFS286) TaxID=483514 RepID=S9PX91_SCHOY|nr:TORC1 subunit Tco89 [Schizosaccharomyces octosporus yFS286]EPX73686.1 TORC1 subunit Tco89 [Schizosaccharomyces octosporus yFS286]